MGKRRMGLLLFLLGLLVILVSLLADAIGLGRAPSIGSKQLAGAGIGVVLAAAGAYVLSRKG